ncbi:DUF2141 domain-containing protein [Thiotrichales bacterium 19S11-10]|nr:DUF2141 domain-containing protein [Thiotrichales bacterium 19S11-10]
MIKPVFFVISLMLLPLYLSAAELTVNAKGFDNNKGNALIAIYNSKEGFPDQEHQFRSKKVAISNLTASTSFKGMPKGEYAVVVVHDLNSNSEFDESFFGIPEEEYGFSNHARGSYGPPKFSQAAFQLDENEVKVISITVK